MAKQRLLLLEALIGCVLLFVVCVSCNAIGQKDQENLENQGLYNSSDFVVILNETNFKSSVCNSRRAWFVEFYNSWCGFCHRFAPTWKALAKSIYGWRDIVAVAAIDCANDDNNPLCREYEVMGYPTLKFFPINSNKDFLGLEIKKTGDIVNTLIDQLEKEQQEQRGGPNWPNIVPYRGTEIGTLLSRAPSNILYEFLIFEEPKTYLGAEVMLDLHKLDSIRIRRVSSENEFLCVTNKITKFPSLLVLGRDNSRMLLKIDTVTREGIREVILKFLRSKGISVDIKEDDDEKMNEHHFAENSVRGKSDTNESSDSIDKIYQLDLESTLRYSLNNEIPLSPTIASEKLQALKTYLNILVSYFPMYLPKGKTYLQALKEVLENRNNITGKEFKEQVRFKEKGLSPVYSGPKTWIRCKGSSPTFRGYPCGLWTMFHMLTVAAAEEVVNGVDDEHPSVLAAMHGYIKQFFGCADCSQHFQEMYKRRKMSEVREGDNSILELWRAHNEVNERLAGDETEDPKHKKIQYPAAEDCPKCRLPDGKWNENEILRYLKNKYSKLNIDLLGVSNRLFQHDIDTSATNSGASIRKFNWDFTIFDISICVVLYVVSATILILVCIKFAFKRTYKKKVSLQHLLGW